MKTFYKDNNIEKVYIQVKDILFLKNHNRTPKDVKDVFKATELNYYNVDEYATFSEENVVNFLKRTYFIIDINKFENTTMEDIYKEYQLNELNIRKAKLQKKLMPRKQRKYATGINDALKSLYYYRKALKEYIIEKNKQMKLEKRK